MSTEELSPDFKDIAEAFYDLAVQAQRTGEDPVESETLRNAQQRIADILPRRLRPKFNTKCGIFYA